MSFIEELLDRLPDESAKEVKKEFLSLLKDAKSDSDEMAKETAEKIELWLTWVSEGRLTDQEFMSLMDARKRVIEQYINTLEIKARARLEKIVLGLLTRTIVKILPLVIKNI